MSRGPLVVVGDILLDRDLDGTADRLSPEAPVPVVCGLREVARPGGAGLAALLAAADGREVVLVTALGTDEAGDRLASLLAGAGVAVCAGPLPRRTPEKVRVRADRQPLVRLDWGDDPADRPGTTSAMADAVRSAGVLLVSDYGRGLVELDAVRGWLADSARRVPVVWDPHPRGSGPVPGIWVATPNLAEAIALTGGRSALRARTGSADGSGRSAGGTHADGSGRKTLSRVAAASRAARTLLRRWQAGGVAVTLGGDGALLATAADVPLVVPARPVHALDTCGAGDRFAATVAGALADGALATEAVTAAVEAATRYVEAGGPAVVLPAESGEPPPPAGAEEVIRRTRAAGGAVVATGGCFDPLHAGHVATLQAARRLGDCLVVCVNSDSSVRRLKGPRRPLVPVGDRMRVLAALGCVDAVTIFDERTPLAVLDRIRPDVWVKGGDYPAAALPETDLLARWGGDVVVVPDLAGGQSAGTPPPAGRVPGGRTAGARTAGVLSAEGS